MQVCSSPSRARIGLAERHEQLTLDADVDERPDAQRADPQPDRAVSVGAGRLDRLQVRVRASLPRRDTPRPRTVPPPGWRAPRPLARSTAARAVAASGRGLRASSRTSATPQTAAAGSRLEPSVGRPGAIGDEPAVSLGGCERAPGDDDAHHAALG